MEKVIPKNTNIFYYLLALVADFLSTMRNSPVGKSCLGQKWVRGLISDNCISLGAIKRPRKVHSKKCEDKGKRKQTGMGFCNQN